MSTKARHTGTSRPSIEALEPWKDFFLTREQPVVQSEDGNTPQGQFVAAWGGRGLQIPITCSFSRNKAPLEGDANIVCLTREKDYIPASSFVGISLR